MLQPFFIGIFISLIGSIPLGNLNVVCMHLSSKDGFKAALRFALGAACIEVLYLSVTLSVTSFIVREKAVFQTLQWLTLAFLLLLALGSFKAVFSKKEPKNIFVDNKMPRFLLGLSMSALNPLQFPYWAGWTVYAYSVHWISNTIFSKMLFVTGAGLGTLLALSLFILAGLKMASFLRANEKRTHIAMALFFMIMFFIQFHKMKNY